MGEGRKASCCHLKGRAGCGLKCKGKVTSAIAKGDVTTLQQAEPFPEGSEELLGS